VNSPKESTPTDKLESLREAVEAGTYRPDTEAVAAAILSHWSGEVTADAWLKSTYQEATSQEEADSEEPAEARSETSNL
jgi:Anti-sigma-28 factor, FlgM